MDDDSIVEELCSVELYTSLSKRQNEFRYGKTSVFFTGILEVLCLYYYHLVLLSFTKIHYYDLLCFIGDIERDEGL